MNADIKKLVKFSWHEKDGKNWLFMDGKPIGIAAPILDDERLSKKESHELHDIMMLMTEITSLATSAVMQSDLDNEYGLELAAGELTPEREDAYNTRRELIRVHRDAIVERLREKINFD